MIKCSVYIHGIVRDAFKETRFLYDSDEGDFDVEHTDIFIRELTGKIIDNLSKSGAVDVDVTYGHLNHNKVKNYTIEFYVDDNYHGFIGITICFG